MKILNLYAGIGGNRKLWGDEHEITAVEMNPDISKIYQDFFPNDTVIIGDAHEYLLTHSEEFDFIWSSPPCQSHSSFRYNICVRYRGTEPVYPDFGLYEEIVFLKYHFKGLWVVENVKPYYNPLDIGVKPKLIQRHLFWSNFDIPDLKVKSDKIRTAQIPQLQKLHGFDLSKYKLKNKRQVLRNCISSKLGKHILDTAKNKNQGE